MTNMRKRPIQSRYNALSYWKYLVDSFVLFFGGGGRQPPEGGLQYSDWFCVCYSFIILQFSRYFSCPPLPEKTKR